MRIDRGQAAQRQRVEEVEDRGVRADAQGKRQDPDGREIGLLASSRSP